MNRQNPFPCGDIFLSRCWVECGARLVGLGGGHVALLYPSGNSRRTLSGATDSGGLSMGHGPLGKDAQRGPLSDAGICRMLGGGRSLCGVAWLKNALLRGVSDKRVTFFDKCVWIVEKQMRRGIILPIFSYLRVRIICNARLLVKVGSGNAEFGLRIFGCRPVLVQPALVRLARLERTVRKFASCYR